jgi:hypothetical protein
MASTQFKRGENPRSCRHKIGGALVQDLRESGARREKRRR